MIVKVARLSLHVMEVSLFLLVKLIPAYVPTRTIITIVAINVAAVAVETDFDLGKVLMSFFAVLSGTRQDAWHTRREFVQEVCKLFPVIFGKGRLFETLLLKCANQ